MNIEWILQEEIPEIDPGLRRRMMDRLLSFMADAVLAERTRCAQLCRDRGSLWERTSMSTSTIPEAVAEARSRANEAKYLADLIELEHEMEMDL